MPEQDRLVNRAPTTEEQLRAASIGELRPLTEPIRLVEYDPNWPAQFEREAAAIGSALGKRALQIEHVGSTSVPGLAAKPIIDVLLVVADSADEPAYVPAMEAADYVLCIREPDWYQHRLFSGPRVAVNVHVFATGSGGPEIERMLRFRDRLRDHPADRALYERLKRQLAARDWKYTRITPTPRRPWSRRSSRGRATREGEPRAQPALRNYPRPRSRW
ncbi:MAG TPA: GrpB family protein [Dehalococcoidia bacterium]|nr:GrpB family protein [Dehalococcoidia bacterium]